MAVDLKPHQEKAVNDLHNGSILFGGVGSGKTITSLAYYMKHYDDLDVYVITTAKKRDSLDWETDAAKFGIGKEVDATVAGVLTVDSWNNISKYEGVKGAFFIFDEQRLVGSGSWTKSFLKIARQNQWILLSATPGDTWLDYIPVFLANGFYKNRTEFLREHVVYNRYSKFPKVDRYLGEARLVKYKNQLLVHMPFERHTTRVTEKILVEHDANLLERVLKDRWHVYENRPLRDVAELFSVMRKVVNSDPGRVRSLETLIARHPKLIVFYNFDYELEALRELGNSIQKTTTLTKSDSLGKKHPSTELDETYLENPWKRTSNLSCTESSATLSKTKSTSSSSSPSAPMISSQILPLQEPLGHTSTVSDADESSPLETSSSSATSTTSTTTSTFALAEWNGHKHQPIPTTDRWLYLVQYQAGSEGWNCIDTDAMVFYSLTYSYKNWHQAHGRTDRMNTPFSTLYYYVLMSNSVIDRAVWSSLSKKKSFNESRFLSKIATTDFTKLPKKG